MSELEDVRNNKHYAMKDGILTPANDDKPAEKQYLEIQASYTMGVTCLQGDVIEVATFNTVNWMLKEVAKLPDDPEPSEALFERPEVLKSVITAYLERLYKCLRMQVTDEELEEWLNGRSMLDRTRVAVEWEDPIAFYKETNIPGHPVRDGMIIMAALESTRASIEREKASE